MLDFYDIIGIIVFICGQRIIKLLSTFKNMQYILECFLEYAQFPCKYEASAPSVPVSALL